MKSLNPRAPLLSIHSLYPLRPALLPFYSTAAEDHLLRRRPEVYQPSSQRWKHEEESRSVRVTVWWDFENCTVPNGVNVFRVAQRITSALRSSGIKGPVTINAFGDVAQLSRTTQEALTSTGVCLTHVPYCGKNSSDRFFMADLVCWVCQNPPPMHFFLISGDRDFANILHRLRMSNYNILLATTDCASGVLWSAATIMWPWNGLVRGENAAVKHFNHPPDGLYGSWYGHYRGVLDDPFSDMEQTVASQTDESMESIADTKPRPIPKLVVNGIRQVLSLYPEGIRMSELRAELKRKNVPMDKDLFGHKKFSHLLSSMPNLLKFIPQPSGDGQPLVIGIEKRVVEPPELTLKSSAEKSGENVVKGSMQTQGVEPASLPPIIAPIRSPASLPAENNADANTSSSIDSSLTGPQPPRIKASPELTLTSAETSVGSSTSQQEHDALVEEGFFRRIWRALAGPKGEESSMKNAAPVDSASNETSQQEEKTSQQNRGHSENAHPQRENLGSKSEYFYSRSSPSSSLDVNESDSEKKTTRESGNSIDALDARVGFFHQVASSWKLLLHGDQGRDDRSASIEETTVVHDSSKPGRQVEVSIQSICKAEAHDLFSKPHFWGSLESFLVSWRAADLILKSRTREELVHGLQKESPSVLNGLKEGHLHHLVDLLVSEKKWLEESPSQAFPFRVVILPKRRCIPSNAHGANGLSSLFTGRASQPSLQKLPEQDRQDQSTGPSGKSYNESLDAKPLQNLGKKKKPPNREEILSDCHKLLVELLKENPDGFNMSMFRPAFIQRYGYILDHQTLGYPKLASLIQIMPGVYADSSFILPVNKFDPDFSKDKLAADEALCPEDAEKGKKIRSDNETERPSKEDSVWEELGPVTDMGLGKDSRNTKGEIGDKPGFTVASFSDEDLTDSEDDAHQVTVIEEERKGVEDSSLIRILDSWYSSKEGQKDEKGVADELVDCAKYNAHTSLDKKTVSSRKHKSKPHRTYSFISNSSDDEKEKFVENIMGCLKKAEDSRVHS